MNCRIEGCERTNKMARGYCGRHYENFRSTGNPLSKREQSAGEPKPHCSEAQCEAEVKSRGLCGRHYENLRITGRTTPARDLSLEDRVNEIGWSVTGQGCWEWLGARNGHGYGMINHSREGLSGARAHRVMYKLLVGDLSDESVLRHRCDNPPCVNPDHLTPGTHEDNMRDMAERGRSGVSYEARGGRCPNGHDMTQAGSHITRTRGGRSHRTCIACDRARKARYERKVATK